MSDLLNAIKSEKSKAMTNIGILQFFGDEDSLLEGVQKKILNLAKKLCGKEKIEEVNLVSNSMKFPNVNYCEVLVKLANKKLRKNTVLEIAEYQVVNRDRFFINDIPLFFYVEHEEDFFDAKFSVTNNEWDSKPLNLDEQVEIATTKTPQERLEAKLKEKGMVMPNMVPAVSPVHPVDAETEALRDASLPKISDAVIIQEQAKIRNLTKVVGAAPLKNRPQARFGNAPVTVAGDLGANVDTSNMSPEMRAVYEISDDELKENDSYTINGVNPRLQVAGDGELRSFDNKRDKCVV